MSEDKPTEPKPGISARAASEAEIVIERVLDQPEVRKAIARVGGRLVGRVVALVTLALLGFLSGVRLRMCEPAASAPVPAPPPAQDATPALPLVPSPPPPSAAQGAPAGQGEPSAEPLFLVGKTDTL